MKNNCRCKRITDPSGVWELNDLLGSKVKIKSTSVANFLGGGFDAEELRTVEKIQFRVSVDGKAITILTLKDIDATFTLKDLEFIDIEEKEKEEMENE